MERNQLTLQEGKKPDRFFISPTNKYTMSTTHTIHFYLYQNHNTCQYLFLGFLGERSSKLHSIKLGVMGIRNTTIHGIHSPKVLKNV